MATGLVKYPKYIVVLMTMQKTVKNLFHRMYLLEMMKQHIIKSLLPEREVKRPDVVKIFEILK